MYVTELHIAGVKLLRDFRLELVDADGAPRMWTVLLGENGRCKTSILRAIALAAAGASRGSELADLTTLPDKREPSSEVRIDAAFALPPNPKRDYPGWFQAPPPAALQSTLHMPAGITSMKGLSTYVPSRSPGWKIDMAASPGDVLFDIRGANLPHWFVAGYGTSRSLPSPGSVSFPSSPTTARLASLFDRGALIGTGFADLLEDPHPFSRLLRDVLIGDHVLPEDAVGIELRGRGGIRSAQDLIEGSRFKLRSGAEELAVPATWLSQGYQSTIACVADLLGHVVLELGGEAGSCEPSQLQGLVLIDEIDLHLHPRWQVKLITSLKRALPKVQFVATTHSPMVLPALRREEVVLLDLDEQGNVVANEPLTSPMLLTGSELYRDFFGIDELQPASLAAEHRRYGFLVGNPARTDDEEREMKALQKKLAELGVDPGWEPVPRSTP